MARAGRLLPNCTAIVLPGLGHLLGMQNPALVNARIGQFLKEHAC